MDRINSSNARPNANGAGKRGFHDNADLSGQDATYLTPDFLNTLQEELCAVIEKNGHVLNPSVVDQLYQILATDQALIDLADAIETRLLQYATINLLNSAIQNSLDFASGLMQQHRDNTNPHPQYLLASTFGVSLPMTASVNTPIEDKNCVLGWDGETGIQMMQTGTINWGGSRSGEIVFVPYRAYGQFLLHAFVSTADEYRLRLKVFDKDNMEISNVEVVNYKGGWRDDTINYVFELDREHTAKIEWYVRAGYTKKAALHSSIFVDDRVKRFTPVGYTSIVDQTNANNGEIIDNEDQGYDIYPDFEWFYYSAVYEEYLELSSTSTLMSPVVNVPHYHRANFTQLNTELYVIVEVAVQSSDSPSDYNAIEVAYLQVSTDEAGDAVVAIPLSMRNIAVQTGEKKVYQIAYYETETTKSAVEFPAGFIGAVKTIYVE